MYLLSLVNISKFKTQKKVKISIEKKCGEKNITKKNVCSGISTPNSPPVPILKNHFSNQHNLHSCPVPMNY